MRWLPIAIFILGLAAAASLLLQVDWPDGEVQREPVSVMESTGPKPVARDFAVPARDAVPSLDILAAGEAVPVPIVDERSSIPAWAPAGDFVGRVVDSTGRPLGAAKLCLFGDVELKNLWMGFNRLPPPLAVAVSAADGTFAMSRVLAGKPLVLRVDAPGGRFLLRDGLEALPDQTLDLGEVSLPDGARLVGLVTDADGHEVPGAEVVLGSVFSLFAEAVRRGGCDPSAELGGSDTEMVRTGPSGNFEFDGSRPGSGQLAVFARGFAPWNASLSPKAGERRAVEVQLDRGLRIAGRIVDEQGQPVSGANVTAIPEGRDLVISCAQSDDSGRFELLDLPPKQHSLHAVVRGFANSESLNVQAGAEDVVLALKPLSTSTQLAVEVVDESGAPAGRFELWLAFDATTVRCGSSTDVTATGIVLVPPPWNAVRRGWLWAEAPGQVSLPARLQPRSAANDRVQLQLLPAVPVDGRVVDAATQAGLPGAELRLLILGDAVPPDDTAWTDAAGRFRIEDLPYGDVTLRARAAGHVEQTVHLSEDQPRSVDIPLSGAGTVLIQAKPAWRRDVGSRVDVKLSNLALDEAQRRDGGQLPFVMSELAPGRYEVWVETRAENPALSSQRIEIDVVAAGVTRVDLSALTLNP